MKEIDFEDIKDNYKIFMEEWKNEHHRFRSYDPCKEYFDTHYGNKLTSDEKNEFSLRLFNYLASWGMFRGNDWFIWKSYKVFEGITDSLFNTDYLSIKDIDPLDDHFDLDQYIVKVESLYTDIQTSLVEILKDDDKKYPPHEAKENRVSPLMTCKILMGTYGCVIAYDSYDNKGLRALGVKTPNKLDLSTLLTKTYDIIHDNKDLFKDIMGDMKTYIDPETSKPVNYTVFKVLDMILWEYGKKQEDKKKAKKKAATNRNS